MHKDKRTVRELLLKVLPDINEPDRELLFFVLQKDYHIRMNEPAAANLSKVEEAIHGLFGNSAQSILRKLEGQLSEA
jgi:hypothetical protein